MRKPSLLNKMKESKFFKKMFCYYVKMQLFCRRFKIKTLEKVEKNKSMDNSWYTPNRILILLFKLNKSQLRKAEQQRTST